jgi:hypothetical protein
MWQRILFSAVLGRVPRNVLQQGFVGIFMVWRFMQQEMLEDMQVQESNVDQSCNAPMRGEGKVSPEGNNEETDVDYDVAQVHHNQEETTNEDDNQETIVRWMVRSQMSQDYHEAGHDYDQEAMRARVGHGMWRYYQSPHPECEAMPDGMHELV